MPFPVVTAATDTSNDSPSSPEHQHQGHGLSLVTDSLRWMARWRVQRALVNTHIGNDAALALYHRLGFTDLNDHLHVYERRIE